MRRAVITALALVVSLFAVATSTAAPPEPQTLNCQGLCEVQILVGPANGADSSFGAARVVGDGHLIPVNFRFSAYDVTAGFSVFDSGLIQKGNGNGNKNQQTVSCTLTETATLADFLDPGETPPSGANLTDTVVFTISVSAIVKS
jgi:hypothetical protein